MEGKNSELEVVIEEGRSEFLSELLASILNPYSLHVRVHHHISHKGIPAPAGGVLARGPDSVGV